jgi:SAM-dependent methyltransferase
MSLLSAARRAKHQAQLAYWRLRPLRAELMATVAPLVQGKQAFEIGGPSQIFGADGLLPVYPLVASLDNSNYANQTIWEGTIEEGYTFRFDPSKPAGRAFICEATDLQPIASESYDLVLSSHTLEHVANPLRALREWMRVLRPGGALVLVLPQREATFDHRRPVTAFEHLLDDERAGTGEDDLTHLPEILELHDLERDPGAGTREQFEQRSGQVLEFRALHHHVFDADLVTRILTRVGFEVAGTETQPPFHLIAVARSPREPARPGSSARSAPS